MHAILLEVDLSGTEREEGLKNLRETVVPGVKQAPGFQSGTSAVLLTLSANAPGAASAPRPALSRYAQHSTLSSRSARNMRFNMVLRCMARSSKLLAYPVQRRMSGRNSR